METVELLEDRVEFRVLGPLEVVHEARQITVPGVRERALLVFLLLSANRVVPSERLADALCGDLGPERATKTLRVYVSRLRRALRDASKVEVLLTQPPGYVLQVDPEACDAFRFEQLTSEGRRRATVGDYEGSAGVLRAALGLWRGPALADLLDFPFAQGEATRLEEARLAALEGRIEAELLCGRHGELTGELEGLTREHPFRERLWGQRMLALYRCGRQADALACFQQLRRLLGEELGIEPGTSLRTLETAILRHDPDLEWSPTRRPPEEAIQAPIRPPQELQERADPASFLSLICTRCGRSTSANQRFCGWCGNPSLLPCPSCGHGNPLEGLFCEACGVALSPPAPEGVFAEERRWATVLCSDLVEPDDRDITDPEALRARRARIVRDIRVILQRFGASTVQVAEDHVLAVFGAPQGHDDDPERAVRAALELQSWAEARAEGQGSGLFRLAVNTGEMLFGKVDPEQPFTVVGQPVSTAFRFRAAATPGQIIVGEETHRATRHAIRYERMRAVSRGGELAETAPTFVVVDALHSPSGRRVSDTSLVGRTRELGMAEALWERVVADRRPHLLTVLGPAGIGKSRFARELSDRVARDGGRAISGRSLPYGERTGFAAFAQQVTAAAGITDEDSAPAAREKLVRRISTLVAPTAAAELASHLALLIGLETEVTADQGTLFLAARRFVEALAREQPTVLVYEDLHWADTALFDLVETLAGRARDAPLLLVALARPQLFDVRPRWGAGLTASTAIELPDLTSQQSRDLLGSLLPNADGEVPAESFIEAAGGNPLFLEELSASFLEGRADDHATLPGSILATVGARLDMLPPSERRVLLNASVFGMRFWAGALRALVPDEDLSAILDALEARDLVRRETSSIDGQDGYSFKHVLIRDVAYGRLPRADRATRHAAVARFIEQAAGDRVAEMASVLGHHWQEAGEPSRAVPYLLTAADRAARAWAKNEAVALFGRALDLIPPSEAELRQSTRLRRALTMVQAGQFVAARDELDLIIPELRGRERSEALLARAHCSSLLHEAEAAAADAQEALEVSETSNDEELEGPILGELSLIRLLAGDLVDAVALSEKALAVWPPGTRPAAYAYHLGTRGNASYLLGRYEEAAEYGRRGYEAARGIYSGESALWAGAQLAMGLAGLGRHEEALRGLDELVDLGKQMGTLSSYTAIALNVSAGVLRELGEIAEARRRNHDAIELAASVDFPLAVVQAKVDLLFADLIAGQVEQAELAWPRLASEAGEIRGVHHWLVVGRLLSARAEISLALGRADRAVDEALHAIGTAHRVGRVKYEIAARITLGRALVALGRAPQAVAELRQPWLTAERLGHPLSLWRAGNALATALEAAGDEAKAKEVDRKVRASHHRYAESLSEERRRDFLEIDLWHGLGL